MPAEPARLRRYGGPVFPRVFTKRRSSTTSQTCPAPLTARHTGGPGAFETQWTRDSALPIKHGGQILKAHLETLNQSVRSQSALPPSSQDQQDDQSTQEHGPAKLALSKWHAGRDSTRRCAPESNPRLHRPEQDAGSTRWPSLKWNARRDSRTSEAGDVESAPGRSKPPPLRFEERRKGRK